MRVEIPLKDPYKLLRPILEFVHGEILQLVAEQQIAPADQQKAMDGIVSDVLPQLMRWTIVAENDDYAKAAVVIELKDDGAARTLMRQAAIEAVKLKG